MHDPRRIRLLAVAVCATGIAGMIITSIRDSTDGALTFGLVTVAAALALLLLGAVVPSSGGVDEVTARELEVEIADLVDAGVDERRLRRIVHLARRMEPPSK